VNGSFYVLPTAFDSSGELDLDSQANLVHSVLDWGVEGVTVLGVMGEASALSDHERRRVIETTVAATSGRVEIVVGCSAASASRAAALVAEARQLGATAAMLSAPPLLRDTDQLPGFFRRSADLGLPLVIQDEPRATGVVMPVSTIVASLRASGASVVKLEDPPTSPKIRALLSSGLPIDVFGGLGGVSVLSELRVGASGVMTGFAFPEILGEIHRSYRDGREARAAAIFYRYLPILTFEGQATIGLRIRKEILRRRGALRDARTRDIGGPLEPYLIDELDEVLDQVAVTPSASRFVVP
jgi:4-hydroxy-tetrahydrodipicolinate synthase